MQFQPQGGPDGFLGMQHRSLGLELRERQVVAAAVLRGYAVEHLDDFRVAVLADEPARGLHHVDQSHARYGHDEDEGSASEVEVAPAHVLRARAYCSVRGAAVVTHEAPCEETGDGVADGPPYSHEG